MFSFTHISHYHIWGLYTEIHNAMKNFNFSFIVIETSILARTRASSLRLPPLFSVHLSADFHEILSKHSNLGSVSTILKAIVLKDKKELHIYLEWHTHTSLFSGKVSLRGRNLQVHNEWSFSPMTLRFSWCRNWKRDEFMFNFITLTITIWTQAKYDNKLLHDFTKFQVQKTFR